jgi:hypothetical protein
LVEIGKLRADEYRALQARDVAACYNYASAAVVDPGVVKLLPAELGKREQAMHEQIVRTAKKRDKQGTKDSWDKIKASLAQRGFSTADLQMLGRKVESPAYPRHCAAAIATYEEILRLPVAEAGAVLREMFAGG